MPECETHGYLCARCHAAILAHERRDLTEEPLVDYEGQTVCRWVLMAMLCLVVALWGLFLWAIWPA